MILCSALPSSARYRQAVHGRGGAVATAAPEASEAAIAILSAGGNAADAAVAAALVLAVVYPNAGNLGGGGFAVIRIGGETAALDFRETAPADATPGMFLDEDGLPIPEKSLIGPLAAGIPGSPAGLYELHRRWGRLPWIRVVAPAIRLARDGFIVSPSLSTHIAENRTLLAAFPESRELWLPGGTAPEPGSSMRLPALARTLQAYAEQGPDAIMKGKLASAIVRTSREHGGLMSEEDLASYRVVWRDPVHFRAWNHEVISMPLPSSGGIILAESCRMLRDLSYGSLPENGADRAMALAESWRRAFADRYLLGDTAAASKNVPLLLDPRRLDGMAAAIDLNHATPSEELRHPVEGHHESSETTHLSVLDSEGGAVSLTTTLNGNFGCGLLVPEAGFLLNNEMDDFSAAPGRANQFGLVQGRTNAVGPGKRMLSSMSPTIAWKNGDILVLGAPGGSRIPTGTLQVLLNLIVDGDGLGRAVGRPRLHHQWLPDTLYAEMDALSPESRKEVEKRGLKIGSKRAVGLVQAVRMYEDGSFEAAADPRSDGTALVGIPDSLN